MNLEPKPDEKDIDSPNYVDPEQSPVEKVSLSDDYDDDDDEDDYDLEGPPYNTSEYGVGWDDGYAYAQSHWLVWLTWDRLTEGLHRWWTWRKAHLRWKLADLRRWIHGVKTDNSDIPF